MNIDELKQIVAKYRKKSRQEYRYGADKCAHFERIADEIEDNIDYYSDGFEDENEIIDDVKEVFEESDLFYDDLDDEDLDNLN